MTNERFSRTPPAKATELFEKLLATSDKAVKARERMLADLKEEMDLLASLQEAGPVTALRTGLLVILLMPSDIIVMLTISTDLRHNDQSYVDAIPFILLTTLIAALPLLAYVLFHRRAVRAMPSGRDWINGNAWLLNIIVCLIFIALIL